MNLNDNVRFIPTQRGREILLAVKQGSPVDGLPGMVEMQLHAFMNLFGPYLSTGQEQVIEKNELIPQGSPPSRPAQKPSIGRDVHYTNLGDKDGKYPPEIQAAKITGLNADGTVSLKIFYRTGIFDMQNVERAADDVVAGTDAARGKWQWPVLT